MQTLEISTLLILSFKNVFYIYLAICFCNLILVKTDFGIKLKYFKKLKENKVNPIYQLKYSHFTKAYMVKKYNLCWYRDDNDNHTILFLIPFYMLFFKYGYVEENGGYKYGSKSDYVKFEHLIGERDILEKDLETFYESKKLEANKLFEKRSEQRIINKNKIWIY